MQTDHHPPLMPPAYPALPGTQQPELNLAGISTPSTDLSGGNFTDATPPLRTTVPRLSTDDPQGDLHLLGIDPETPYFELNLAGEALPVPRPASLADAAAPEFPGGANAPTFGIQDYAVPLLRPYDLTGPGIDAMPPMQPDPGVLQLAQPLGLYVYPTSDGQMPSDPTAPGLGDFDRPAGLEIPDALASDPALPDLHTPMLTQQVMMPDRPGDLASGALDAMRDDASYRQLGDASYREVYMDASGINTTRRRHMELLMRGLDAEEG